MVLSQQPEVIFHFNVNDRLEYACRLLRKAYQKGTQVLVLADETLAHELDQKLWTLTATEFIPHVRHDDPADLCAKSPIVINSTEYANFIWERVLLNLRDAWPEGCEQCHRIIEVVTRDSTVVSLARQRWKRYKSQGIEPQYFDLSRS